MSIDSQEFYNFHMIEFLQAEYLHAGGALVHTFKNGSQKVYKKDVKRVHPLIKDDLADFVRDHPEVLERYKEMAGAKGPLENRQLDADFREEIFAEALIERLRAIPGGNDNATPYHRLATGISTFLFYPDLITPIKEYEQHDGRKRVDIVFTNAANDGFSTEVCQRHKLARYPYLLNARTILDRLLILNWISYLVVLAFVEEILGFYYVAVWKIVIELFKCAEIQPLMGADTCCR